MNTSDSAAMGREGKQNASTRAKRIYEVDLHQRSTEITLEQNEPKTTYKTLDNFEIKPSVLIHNAKKIIIGLLLLVSLLSPCQMKRAWLNAT